MAEAVPQYRLVVFEEIEDPKAVRDLFCRVTHLHPTDAMQWIARAPGTWPWPLPADEVRALLDGLYDLGVAAEAWLVGHFPDLSPPRNVHSAACLAEGFRVEGLRGEPTHWVPWKKIELLSAGRIEAEDEFRHVVPPRWSSSLALGVKALFKRPGMPPRRDRAMRIPRDPVGEIIIVRNDPRIAFRVVENQMNYAYLGKRRQALASENFPIFVADLCAAPTTPTSPPPPARSWSVASRASTISPAPRPSWNTRRTACSGAGIAATASPGSGRSSDSSQDLTAEGRSATVLVGQAPPAGRERSGS